MKYIYRLLIIFAAGLVACWLLGWVEFTYVKVVPNEPLLHPRQISKLQGTNMVMQDGQIIALWPSYPGRSTEESHGDISNKLRLSDFQVDIDTNYGQLDIYVRHKRKFRDSSPPFTIPLIRETVGRKSRQLLAHGEYLSSNSRSGDPTNASRQPLENTR